MRVNIYSQELTTETELVSKTGVNAAGKSETFYGVRVYLRSPAELHHTASDDDRSAVTFWLPGSEHRRADLVNTFYELAWLTNQAGHEPDPNDPVRAHIAERDQRAEAEAEAAALGIGPIPGTRWPDPGREACRQTDACLCSDCYARKFGRPLPAQV